MPTRKSKSGAKNLFWRNGVAYARIKIAGIDQKRSLHTSDRKEAERRLKIVQADAARIRFGERPRYRYDDAVEAWADTSYGGVKDGTVRRYQVSLRMLDPYFAGKFLDEITRATIGEFVRARAKVAKHATVRRDLTALSRLLSAAVALGFMDHNPAREWDRTVIKEKREPSTRVDMRSVQATIGAAPFPYNHLIAFLLSNGSRLEETAALEERNVDLDAATATFTKTKATRPRTLDLSPESVAILREIPRPNLPNPFVFWNPNAGLPTNNGHMRGAQLSNISRRAQEFKRAAAKKAKAEGWEFRDFRLHDLRHEYAIRWLEEGRSIYRLQKHLGHTSVKTTEIYLAFVPPEAAAKATGA